MIRRPATFRLVLFMVISLGSLLFGDETTLRLALVAEARTFIGAPYLAGGSSPRGSDCSGLTSAVYRKVAALEIPRSASGQYREGRSLEISEAKPGDILCFDTLGGPSHVALYIGGRDFIHARDYGKPACVSSLDEDYYRKRFIGARRFLPEAPQLASAGKPSPAPRPSQGSAALGISASQVAHVDQGRVESLIPFVIPGSASIQRSKIPALTNTWIEARLDARVDVKGFSWEVIRGEWKKSRKGTGHIAASGKIEGGAIPAFLLDKPGVWSLVVYDASGKYRASLVMQAKKP